MYEARVIKGEGWGRELRFRTLSGLCRQLGGHALQHYPEIRDGWGALCLVEIPDDLPELAGQPQQGVIETAGGTTT